MFDVTYGQLSIITKISYNFVEIVLVAQCYLIITYVVPGIKEADVQNIPSPQIS